MTIYASDIEGVGNISEWELKSANFEVEYGKGYFVDANGVAKTITLPDTALTPPKIGTMFVIDNHTKTAATYNLTIQAHANDGGTLSLVVEGVASQDIVIDVSATRVLITYVSAGYGWRIKVY